MQAISPTIFPAMSAENKTKGTKYYDNNWPFQIKTFTKYYGLSGRFPIPNHHQHNTSCDSKCQIIKISSLCYLAYWVTKKIVDYWTYLNFSDHYLKRFIIIIISQTCSWWYSTSCALCQIVLWEQIFHWGSPHGHWKRIHWIRIPRSGFNVVLHKLHTACRLRALHCLTGSHALSRSSNPDRGRMEANWFLNPDPWSASDADPRSRVENTIIVIIVKYK